MTPEQREKLEQALEELDESDGEDWEPVCRAEALIREVLDEDAEQS